MRKRAGKSHPCYYSYWRIGWTSKTPSLLTDDNLNVITKDGTPDPDVWAIGDAAVMQNQRLPATAQGQPPRSNVSHDILTDNRTAVANQKAKYLVKKLNKIIKGQNLTKPFEFHNQGSLAYIGDWSVAMRSHDDLSIMLTVSSS
jgi:NADH dehydrogenase FAD-containing subunit